jgi:hypothetical protein
MGHSKYSKSIASEKFRPSMTKAQAQREHAKTLSEKDAVQTVDYFCRYVLPVMPNGAAKVPVYYAVRYGAQFLYDTHHNGAEYAAKQFVTTVVKDQVISMATSYIWSAVDDRIISTGTNKALAKPAEEALGDAIGAIVEMGIDAL